MSAPPEDDHELAVRLAREAGSALLELRGRAERDRWNGWRTQDEGDAMAHDLLMEALAAARPDDAVLSEEGHDDRARLDSSRVWIVDPLDGSNDYGSPYSDDWAVHVALVVDGVPTAAAVSVPAHSRVFGTAMSPIPGIGDRSRPDVPTVIASRAQAHWGQRLAIDLGGQAVVAGSAGVKAMAVVQGHADVYIHPTGLYEWDVCAPAAVAQAAGLHVCGIDGAPFSFNQPRPVVVGFVVCQPALVDEVLGLL